MIFKLSFELVDATKGSSGAIGIKKDTHRMTQTNKAFVHFSHVWINKTLLTRVSYPKKKKGHQVNGDITHIYMITKQLRLLNQYFSSINIFMLE